MDYDAVGRITPEELEAVGVPIDGLYYLCGPIAFMDALSEGLAGLGVAVDRIHTEMFGAEGSLTPGIVAAPRRPPHQPDGEPGSGPLISFVRTGLNVHWSEARSSILELAEACDVPVRWSCRTGVCHTCETGLLDGTVDYSPEPLEAPADGNLLVCCRAPKPISRSTCDRPAHRAKVTGQATALREPMVPCPTSKAGLASRDQRRSGARTGRCHGLGRRPRAGQGAGRA